MATFTDDFNRDDENLEASGWQALDSSDGTVGVALVSGTRAIAADRTKTVVAWYTDVVPTGVAQETGAYVTALSEGTNCYVDVGALGTPAAADFATNPRGVWARLSWLANGARRLSIHRFLPGETTSTQINYVDIVLDGSVDADGFEGLMDGTLGVRHRLRILVDTDDAGLRARAFVNQDDDDKPALSVFIDRDFPGTGIVAQPYGCWWIGFGPGAATTGDLAVSGIYGDDFAPTTDIETQDLRSDQPTLGEASRETKLRFLGTTQVSADSNVVDQAIRDTIEDIVTAHGENAWFMRRTETLALTVDTIGRTTLQPRMRRVIWVKDAYGCDIQWRLLDHTTSGAPRLDVSGYPTSNYEVHYLMRHVQAWEPHHVLPLPREFFECLIQGACMRMAGQYNTLDKFQRFRAEYDRLMGVMAADLHHTQVQRRVTLMPRRFWMPYDRYRG